MTTTSIQNAKTTETAGAIPPGRLPQSVRPQKYDLALQVDPDQGTFSAQEAILATAESEVSRIILHATDLKIERASVNGIEVPADRQKTDSPFETLTLELSRAAQPGPLVIELIYSGKLNRQMRGLYLSTAKHEGKEENYAFTQFEPTDARRMFPCFDEPAFKSKFRLVVTAPKKFTILSNMPAEKESIQGDNKTVSFGETPQMSTYLLALAVARLSSKSRKVGKTQVTVWTRPEDIHQADFALNAAQASLSRLNAYFDLPYQLPKLDLVAVPDFAAGAMENWGAIFFRDSAILVDPKLSSARARRRVAGVVAHEIVHQWFGNLVTMEWWNDLWLNEAFATWLGYKIVDDWHPDWLLWQDFEQGKRSALAEDALKNTRPISSGVASVAEIEAQFDALTYLKGGAVLRMLENFLGANVFRRGLRRYTKKYSYQNTRAADLWRELETASNQPVMKIAQDWIGLPGYPWVGIRSVSADNRRLEISQSRFSAHGPVKDSPLWNLPIVIKYKDPAGTHSYRLNLTQAKTIAVLPGKGKVSWLYPNEGQTGFYRSALDQPLLKTLGREIAELKPLEQAGLLNDLWAEARAGQAELGAFLDTLYELRKSNSRLILEDAASYLTTLNDRLIGSSDRPLLANLTSELLDPHWKKLGWTPKEKESDEVRLSRAAVLWTLGYVAQPPELLKETQARLQHYLQDPESLDPALVSPVLNLGAKTGDIGQFERYRQALNQAKTPEVRDNFLGALAKFTQPDSARNLVQMTLSNDIRGQDIWKPVSSLLGNPAAQGLGWQLVKEHWDPIRQKTGNIGSRRIIEGLSNLWSRDWLDDIRDFFAKPKNQVEAAKRSLDQSLELIELGIRFKEMQTQPLSGWLAARNRPQRKY
ncbi:MAG: M1 family metallopeptidase [Elusimicrobia bacterium]|nr:M1 family metallopeptidase [Elusimicrobiota bacterium]